MKIVNSLNLEQKEASQSGAKRSLVIASAGTGKTSTIMARVEYLLDNGYRPESMVLITFTSKAAIEIKERLMKFFDKETVSKIEAGTFHAIALKKIKMVYPKLKLIKSFESIVLIKEIISKVGLENVKMPVNEKGEIKPVLKANQLHYIFSSFSSSGKDDLDDFIFGILGEEKADGHPFYLYERIYEMFQNRKKELHFFEFNDLLEYAVQYPSEIGLKNFQHLIVDEYQDCNRLQEEFIDVIEPDTLFCVGDYDQSIYGFNGSDVGIIASFLKKHDGKCEYFNLKRNYRSAPKIIELAEKAISINPRIFPKEIIAEYKGITGLEKPEYFSFSTVLSQFEAIAARIMSIPESKRSDVAILYRGNASAITAEIVLNQFSILSQRKAGKNFFDRDDVKIILSTIDMATGRFTKEALMIAYFDREIRHETIDKFYDNIEKRNFVCDNYAAISDGTQEYSDGIYLAIKNFVDLRQSCKKLKNPLSIIDKVFESELFSKLMSRKKENSDLDMLKDIIKNASTKHKDIKKSLESLTKKPNFEQKSNDNSVQLMTVHASKGLEFDTVFIVDLNEKKFPNARLLKTGGTLEEERRLFYVAITRAKNTLWLCYPKQNEKKKFMFPSRFLIETRLENNFYIGVDENGKEFVKN